MEQDDGLGTETDEIAGLGTAGVRGTADSTGNDAGVAHHLAAVLLTHALGCLGSLSLVGTALGTLGQMVGSDESPGCLDAARLDDGHVDAEMARLHAQRVAEGFEGILRGVIPGTDRTSFVVRGFLQLLQGGASQSHRDVGYYARELNVSVKYLENTVRRQTGQSVMSFIDRYTVPMIVELLKQDGLSFSQIAERMNFASLSYFSRYVTKHLGMSPTQYRQTQSPKK